MVRCTVDRHTGHVADCAVEPSRHHEHVVDARDAVLSAPRVSYTRYVHPVQTSCIVANYIAKVAWILRQCRLFRERSMIKHHRGSVAVNNIADIPPYG